MLRQKHYRKVIIKISFKKSAVAEAEFSVETDEAEILVVDSDRCCNGSGGVVRRTAV